MTDRLAELEVAAAKLSAEIAALKSGSGRQDNEAAPRAIVQEEGVRISALLTERTDLPNLKELQRLFEIVKHRAPWPQARYQDERQLFRSFSSSFRWISNKGRTKEPNQKIDLSFWIDEAKTWLRSRNSVGSDVDANGIVLAALADGDCHYIAGDGRLGHVWTLALAQYGGLGTDGGGWRRVLRDGASGILVPSQPARSVTVVPSNIRIVGGW